MANGQRTPIFKPSETLEAILLSAKTVHQILLCSLFPSITKESKSKAPKRPPKPLAPNFDPADEPPSYRPGEKASGDETPSSSPSSSETEGDDSRTPKEISSPLHRPGPEANTFPLREAVGPEGPTWVHVPFSVSDMSQTEEKLGSFSENPTRYIKKFLRHTQAYHLT